MPEILSDPAVAAAVAQAFARPAPAGLPAGGILDPAGRFFDLDAIGDGVGDLRLLLGGTGDTLIA
ncbi:MAG: hypothetical protein ICV73_20715 [Acetobacteraceae bacterium]|nr:hypothetical protein [Acetobacteraceae bacterium]